MKYFNIHIDTPGSHIPTLVRRVPQNKLRQCEHGELWFFDSEGNRYEVITVKQVSGNGAELSNLASEVYGSAVGSRAANRLQRGIEELMTAYVEEMRMLGYTVEESRQVLLDLVGESVDSISKEGLRSV